MSEKKDYRKAVHSALLDQVEKSLKEAEDEPDEELDCVDLEDREETDDEVRAISSENLVENDFLVVRKNLKKLIRKGNIALDRVVRAIEGKEKKDPERTTRGPSMSDLCDLMKTLILSNKELMNTHEVKNRILNPPSSGKGGGEVGGKVTEDNELLIDSSTLGRIVGEILKPKLEPTKESTKKK